MERQKRNKRQVKTLVKNGIGFPPHITERQKRQVLRASSVMERMEVQWKFLGPDDDWEGMKQSAECCRRGIPRMEKVSWEDGKPNLYQTAQDFVEVDFYKSGRINPRGTVKCNGLECSWCGRHKRKELADYLEMALQQNTRMNGKNVFGTMTQQVQTDPVCVVAASQALAKVLKRVDKWNAKNKTQIGMFSTQETLFSPKKRFYNYRDTTAGRFGIGYHSHIHFILMVPERDEHKSKRLMELMREWWVKDIEDCGGQVFRHNKKSLINKDVAFRIEKDIPPDQAISRYITKHLKSKELVYAETKDADGEPINIGLEELKTRIHLGEGPTSAYVRVLRDYHKALKNKSRFKSTKKIIGNLVLGHKRHLDVLRTAAAYDFVMGRSFSGLLGRPKHEITIITQIKDYEMKGADSGGETMGRMFGLRSLPGHLKGLLETWEYRDQRIREALKEGDVLWRGNQNTWVSDKEADLSKFIGKKVAHDPVSDLLIETRKKEKELWETGQWSYLEDEKKRNPDILVATYRFATKFWNLITARREVARVLYRMRKWFLFREDGMFYEFIHLLNQIFMKADVEIERTLPKLALPVKPTHDDVSEVPDILKGVLRGKRKDDWIENNKSEWKRYKEEIKEIDDRVKSRREKINERNALVLAYLDEAMNESDEWLAAEVRKMRKQIYLNG